LQLLRIFNLGDIARPHAPQAGEAAQTQAAGKRLTSRLSACARTAEKYPAL
jgi:hypothetical protein